MKNISPQHRPNDLFHNRCHNGCHDRKRGSIMIWTIMLGLLLTSVFFFFSMRQRMMLGVQRDTATIQNAKLFLESYADYLEKRCKTGGCVTDPITIDSTPDSTKGTVTQMVDSIENAVDFGKQQDYEFTGSIYVEWNKCVKTNEAESSGDLLINDVLYEHQPSVCAANEEYDDVVGPISVTDPFAIKTLNAPFSFRIKPSTGQLIDNQWHLEMSKDLDYGKKITIKRTF